MWPSNFGNPVTVAASFVLISIFVPLSLHAADVRDILNADNRYGAVLLADLSLTPTADNQRCLSRHDDMVLTVLDGSELVASRHYCSSYASGSVHIFSDGMENRFLALEYSEGRGTNATTDRLKIYQIGSDLVDLGDMKIGGGTGPSSRWRYGYHLTPLPEGGLQLDLRLVLDGKPDCCVPDERQKTVRLAPVARSVNQPVGAGANR